MSGIRLPVSGLLELARQALAGRVARELAHDINDLLVGVVTVAACTDDANLPELRDALRTNAEYGRKIADQVRAFQDFFSQSESQGPGGPLDLADAIERFLELCRRRMTLHGIEIKNHIGSLPRVQADIGPAGQVFLELFHRALDATSAGGALELTAEELGKFVSVSVSVPGRTTADMTDALELLRGSEAEDGGGGAPADAARGIGLAAAMHVVRQYGGELTAESTLGNVSRFTVRLPVWRQNAEP